MKDIFDNEGSLSLDEIDADLDTGSDLSEAPFYVNNTDSMTNDDEQPMSQFISEVFSRLDSGESALLSEGDSFKVLQFPDVSVKKLKLKSHSKRDLAIHAYSIQKKNY